MFSKFGNATNVRGNCIVFEILQTGIKKFFRIKLNTGKLLHRVDKIPGKLYVPWSSAGGNWHGCSFCIYTFVMTFIIIE